MCFLSFLPSFCHTAYRPGLRKTITNLMNVPIIYNGICRAVPGFSRFCYLLNQSLKPTKLYNWKSNPHICLPLNSNLPHQPLPTQDPTPPAPTERGNTRNILHSLRNSTQCPAPPSHPNTALHNTKLYISLQCTLPYYRLANPYQPPPPTRNQ